MEGPPPQIVAKSLDDYLEQLSKGVFQAGISWRVVDSKWPSITTAFHTFRVERVARMTDRDIDALVKDERVIRSRPKIAAVVHNAVEDLKSFNDYEPLASDLKKRFKFVGDSGVYHFLWTVKHPVPDWREWSRAHGKDWEAKAKASPAGQPRAKRPNAARHPTRRSPTRATR